MFYSSVLRKMINRDHMRNYECMGPPNAAEATNATAT